MGGDVMDHIREQRSLLADREAKLLIWLARRMPQQVTSDALSLVGLLSMLAAAASFVAIRHTPWGAALLVAALAANWFGDSLDGTLARVRNRSEEHTSELQSHSFISYAVFCL